MKPALLAVAVVAVASALLRPNLAAAEAPAEASAAEGRVEHAAPPGMTLIKDEEAPTQLVPRAQDLLGKHVLVGAAVGPVWSLGRLDSETKARRAFGAGLGFRADAGFGLSRVISVGAWGSYARYSDGSRCADCAGRAFAVGPFVRYHLSQGLRFAPWLTAAAGYRQVSFVDDLRVKQKYSGVEWLRLELGADYYVLSGFGLGPYGSVALSSYSSRPAAAGNVRVNTELSAGLRILLDLPGR